MVFDGIDPTIVDWLYAREMMRRFGFSPDEIFFAVHPTGHMLEGGVEVCNNKPTIILRIQAQGLDFNWDIGATELPDSEIQSAFEKACEIWNSAPDSTERDLAFKTSVPFRNGTRVVAALKAKGFVLGRWN